MGDFSLDAAQIVAAFVGCILYGIHLVTTGIGVHVLFGRRKYTSTTTFCVLLAAALIMLVVASLDVVLRLVQNLLAFVYYHGNGGADAYFLHISSWICVGREAIFLIQSLIGDATLVYRCFIIYNRNYVVILLPILLLCSFTIIQICEVYSVATMRTDAFLSASQLTPFQISSFALTALQNIITTGMILYKIWGIHQRSKFLLLHESAARTRLARITRIIVESGLLYTVPVSIFLILCLVKNNGLYPVSDAIVQIIGIAFNLIIIRGHEDPPSGTYPSHVSATVTTTTIRQLSHSAVSVAAIEKRPEDWAG